MWEGSYALNAIVEVDERARLPTVDPPQRKFTSVGRGKNWKEGKTATNQRKTLKKKLSIQERK